MTILSHNQKIAKELNIPERQVTATAELLDAGNTLPFVARYRKEVTGGLDEEQIRTIQSQLELLRSLDERRTAIIASIEEQGKMTPELLATQYGPEIWHLYAGGQLTPASPLSGRYEREPGEVDLAGVMREIDDTRAEEQARRLRMA